MHVTLGGSMAEVRMSFGRIEKFFATLSESGARRPCVRALARALAGDSAARTSYLALTRETEDPALRVRMIGLARSTGWLTREEQRVEQARMIGDMLAANAVGYGEVDLICSSTPIARWIASSTCSRSRRCPPMPRRVPAARHASAAHRPRERGPRARQRQRRGCPGRAGLPSSPPPHRSGRAARAGLGNLEHAAGPRPGRALETLARHHISDREVLDRMARLYASARSASVQRAVAEVFCGRTTARWAGDSLLELLRQHRCSESRGRPRGRADRAAAGSLAP